MIYSLLNFRPRRTKKNKLSDQGELFHNSNIVFGQKYYLFGQHLKAKKKKCILLRSILSQKYLRLRRIFSLNKKKTTLGPGK